MRPDWQFVMVGPDIDGAVWHSDLDRLFNIHWLDRDRPERYAWHADVVLLPWRGDERLPAPDVRDLMHAGVPVLACPHGQLDDMAGVWRAEDAAGFSAALAELRPQLATPELTASLRSAATGHTWKVVANRVLEAVAAARKRAP
jgi:glycosyltransferase involved in cell wall biosynthesis